METKYDQITQLIFLTKPDSRRRSRAVVMFLCCKSSQIVLQKTSKKTLENLEQLTSNERFDDKLSKDISCVIAGAIPNE